MLAGTGFASSGRQGYVSFSKGGDMGNTERCVFVFSTGRCGTMTLSRILSQHASIVGLHEHFPRLIRLSGEAHPDPKGVWARLAIAVARKDLISEVDRRGKIYAETANGLTFFAYAINKVFPCAKFIHLVRHPFAVIDSGIRRGWYAGHPWDEGRIVPRE